LAADLTRPRALPGPAEALKLGAAPPEAYEPLERVVLTDEVSRTLFEEYAGHRKTDRGEEETGWLLLGLRHADHVVVMATLPAGTERDAGEAHVQFNSPAQTLGYRIAWQWERRLTILGVVHTHPGSLRHPSKGDLKGDREWVPQLKGGQGVFGIGTADADEEEGSVALHPRPHVQCLGGLRFTWYTLAAGDKRYRDVPVELTIGPDLAKPLRAVWPVIESHAKRLDRLARQQTKVRFDIADGRSGPALAVTVGLAEPGKSVRVVLEGKEVRYFYEAEGSSFQADLPDTLPDQGLYLLLAELAARS